MPPPENLQATQKLLQELLASVTTLHKEVTTLKADDDHRSYPQKWPCDSTVRKMPVAITTTTAIVIAISTPVRMKQIPQELGAMAPNFSYPKKAKPP